MLAGVGVVAEAPDHSGTWRLNRDSSQITKGAGLTGLGAGGVPPTLYVTQSANGTAVVGSDINESAAKLYQVSAKGLLLERDGTTELLSIKSGQENADGQDFERGRRNDARLQEKASRRRLRTVADGLSVVATSPTVLVSLRFRVLRLR